MSKTTTLASGAINGADEISIELVQPADTPAVVLLRWPDAPSVCDPRRLTATANATMRILARAVAQLALIRAAELDS
jgi:hypothetical protein